MRNEIVMYGTWWCGDCMRTRRFFDRHNIPYRWVDIDRDESGEAFVLTTNHGMRSVPTIILDDGSILVEPSEATLKEKLRLVYPPV